MVCNGFLQDSGESNNDFRFVDLVQRVITKLVLFTECVFSRHMLGFVRQCTGHGQEASTFLVEKVLNVPALQLACDLLHINVRRGKLVLFEVALGLHHHRLSRHRTVFATFSLSLLQLRAIHILKGIEIICLGIVPLKLVLD